MNQITEQKHKNKIYQGSDGKWRTYIQQDGKRKLIVRVSKKKLEEYLDEYYKIENDITLAGLYNDWIAYKELHVSEPTVRRLKYSWKKYYSGEAITETPIQEITKIDFDIWIHKKIKDNKLNKKKYCNFIAVLNGLLEFAVDTGILNHNPKKDIKIGKKVLQPTKKPADETQVFTPEEFSRLRELCLEDFASEKYPKNTLIPLAVLFMFFSGLRISEIAVIRYEDIKNNILTVRRMYRITEREIIDGTKGEFGERQIPLIQDARDILLLCQSKQQERQVSTEYIFSMTADPAPYDAIRKAFYKYSRKLEIIPKSSHKARKTFISTLIDGGVNINTIRQIAGHENEETTFHNYTFDRRNTDEKFDILEEAFSKSIQNKSGPFHEIPNKSE